MILTSNDCLITLVYFAVVLGVGYSLRGRITTGSEFFQAGLGMPAWLSGLAFLSAGLGIPALAAMGAVGAKYGFAAARFYLIGAIPAMIVVALFMMPLYYGSKARSVAEFLGLRFDQKTRALNACLFAAMTVFSSGISMYVMGRIIQALHIFDGLFRAKGWPLDTIFVVSVVVPAVVVLAYVLLGGLRGTIYNHLVQLLVLVAGLLPVVLLGLKKIGGWSGLKASVPGISLYATPGAGHAGGSFGIVGLGVALGLVLGASYWCSDFRVIQIALAAKSVDSARRVPLIAALPAMLLPLLMIVPGLVAIGLPTPHTTTFTRYEKDAIIHEITVVSPEAEQGDGLVPARVDPATRKVMLDAGGHPLLDYDMATPNLLLNVLPTGLLGLGLTALVAYFMSGIAANLTAFNAVFTYDLYQPYIHQGGSDGHYLAAGRWATVAAVLLAIGPACAAFRLDNLIAALLLVFSVVTAPLLAVLLLGMLWKHATGHGAFAGLIAGAGAALVHHGLTLPADAHRGIDGGWIAVLHSYSSDIAQMLWTAVAACGASLLITVVVSLCTMAKAEAELVGLVHGLTPRSERIRGPWWKRPGALAVAILLIAIGLVLFFA